MAGYRNENHEEMNENVLSKSDVFTVWVAIFLYISFGVLLTIGGVLWVRSELKVFFDISYAGYGMLILVIFLVSELWAWFIQIPSIQGYDEIVAPWADEVRLILGELILFISAILCMMFFPIRRMELFTSFLQRWCTD